VSKVSKFSNFKLVAPRKLALMSTCVAAFSTLAAAETPEPSAQSILSTMGATGGRETVQWQLAPSYSELFGFGVRATVGGYVSEDFALGLIIDYAEHREEYLANAGFRLNENMRVIGSFGLLKESEEFVLGAGREDVRQLQYGLSLKGSYDAGIVRGFEINAYHTDASSKSESVETGDLTGLQVMTHLQPSSSSDLRLGAGYERAKWTDGAVDTGLTLQAIGAQRLSDVLSFNYTAKLAQTEKVFGLGLTYDLSSRDMPNSAISVSYNQIKGKQGISDDKRIALNLTIGLGRRAGGGSSANMSSSGAMPTLARTDLLADVMTRPAFLPERVLARTAPSSGLVACQDFGIEVTGIIVLPGQAAFIIMGIFTQYKTIKATIDDIEFKGTGGGFQAIENFGSLVDGMTVSPVMEFVGLTCTADLTVSYL